MLVTVVIHLVTLVAIVSAKDACYAREHVEMIVAMHQIQLRAIAFIIDLVHQRLRRKHLNSRTIFCDYSILYVHFSTDTRLCTYIALRIQYYVRKSTHIS